MNDAETSGTSRGVTAERRPPSAHEASPGELFLTATWFGLVTGLVEGAGLLLFQRINWRNWGPTVHVSAPILWISPLVDWVFFQLVVLALLAFGWARHRRLSVGTALSVFIFLMVFDWLDLTSRLYYWSCLLLALGAAWAVHRSTGRRQSSLLRVCRASVPWVVVAFALILAGVNGGNWLRECRAVAELPPAASGSPNVLVIVVDTLRADHLSAYGYNRPTSPNIDHIAQHGALFENAIAPSSWSLPSHASLLTGRYQFEHGTDNVQPMPWTGWGNTGMGGYPTLGEALEKRGYRTGAFSANRVYFTRSVGLGRGFIHFEDYFHSAADSFLRTLYGREVSRTLLASSPRNPVRWLALHLGGASLFDRDTEGQGRHSRGRAIRKRASVVDQETLDWIDSDRRRPFFAFLNFMDVHAPYGAPLDYPRPAWGLSDDIARYDAGVRYVDDYIGRLMKGLQDRGLDRNTLVIITSDHGESLGQHGLSFHASALYWELIHVPLIVRYPGHVPEDVRISQPVSNAAIAATVMDMLGQSGDHSFRGPSLAAQWESSAAASDWPMPLSEIAQNDIISPQDKAAGVPTAADGDMKSLVTPDWQFIVHTKCGVQLYNRNADAGEEDNLAHNSDDQAELRKFEEALANLVGRSTVLQPSGETNSPQK